MPIMRFLLRPFRRFMLIWGIVFLVTTHIRVVWVCLLVVLAQQIFFMLKLLLFLPWVGENLRNLDRHYSRQSTTVLRAYTASS
jgi:hypothetical protein